MYVVYVQVCAVPNAFRRATGYLHCFLYRTQAGYVSCRKGASSVYFLILRAISPSCKFFYSIPAECCRYVRTQAQNREIHKDYPMAVCARKQDVRSIISGIMYRIYISVMQVGDDVRMSMKRSMRNHKSNLRLIL